MNAIEQHYKALLSTKSDIQDHMPTLKELGKPGLLVVEFGFRTGHSAISFLAGGADIISYDIDAKTCRPYVQHFFKLAGKRFGFILQSSLKVQIQPCDILFIDSLHTYDQLNKELELHHHKVKDLIIMHDTFTFGKKDKVGNGVGLMPAINRFLALHLEWEMHSHTDVCNGLTMLKRLNQ